MHTCATTRCKGRAIDVDPHSPTRWVHADSGLSLCDPLNDALIRALPSPPEVRVISGPRTGSLRFGDQPLGTVTP